MTDNMDSDIWGPYGWKFLHTVTFGYPQNPSEEQKIKYKQLFESLKYTLPCVSCREHYTQHIKDKDTELTDQVFENRDSLTKWLYNIHNKVNVSLKKCEVKYDDIQKTYEKMRVKDDKKKDEKFTYLGDIKIKINKYKLVKK